MNITLISEVDFGGSGYTNISLPVSLALSQLGHRVTVLGLGYKGEEHAFPFPIVPVAKKNFYDVLVAMLHNLRLDGDRTNGVVVALDIPMQLTLLEQLSKYDFNMYGIFPLEAPPLNFSWAAALGLLKQRFVLNRFGVEEFARFGIDAVYLPTYLDPKIWKLRVPGEKESVRDTLGVPKDAKVVTAIAENQERKNLGLMFDIVAQVPGLYLLLVTRRNTGVGWNIDDYLADLKIQDRVFIFERGLDILDLRALVAAADVYLSTSKAEGLAFPVLEAMATGVPVVAPDHTALHEHLADGRGYLYNHAFKYRDPFGNEFRYFGNLESGVEAVTSALRGDEVVAATVARAREYVEHCTLGPIAKVLSEHIS